MSFKRILCPVDLADELSSAVEYAAALARGAGAEAELVYVAPEPAYQVGGRVLYDSSPEARKRIADTLEPELAALAEKYFSGVKVKTTLLYGDPMEALPEYTKKDEWDLLVIATHGRSGWNRFFVGSVAQRLIKLVHIPVVSIKPPEKGK